MAGLALVAGGAGGDVDPPVAEEADHHLALVAGQGDSQDVGGGPRPDHAPARAPAPAAGAGVVVLQFRPCGPCPAPGWPAPPPPPRQRRRSGRWPPCRSAGPSPVRPPGSAAASLSPAADVQGPDPLGSVDLVPAHRQQVHPQLLRGEGHLQKALDRVAVEQGGAVGVARTGLDRTRPPGGRCPARCSPASWTPGRCPAAGPRSRSSREMLPCPVGLEIGHLIALPLQLLAGLQHRGVLDRRW